MGFFSSFFPVTYNFYYFKCLIAYAVIQKRVKGPSLTIITAFHQLMT